MDVSVIVNTVWSGPAGFMISNTAEAVMGSNTTYTSTAIVSSFRRRESGNYTCNSTVTAVAERSSLSYLHESRTIESNKTRVTIGIKFTPFNFHA